MRAEAHDDWLGRGGNPRRSDLTWRRSPLPRGHEPSLTAGVIVLFPGPLTQVRQRRRVRRANRNRVWLAFTHTTANHLLSFIIGHYFCTSIVYYSHEALWSIFRRACVCVCVCVGLVLCHHMLCVYILCYLPRALFSCSRRCEFQVFVWWYDYIFTALYTFMLFDFFKFFFASQPRLCQHMHVTTLPFTPFCSGSSYRLSSVSIAPSSQQRNPTRSGWMFVSCLFVQ